MKFMPRMKETAKSSFAINSLKNNIKCSGSYFFSESNLLKLT